MNGRRLATRTLLVAIIGAGLTACIPPPGGGGSAHAASFFCQKLQQERIVASQGARMYCFGGASGSTGLQVRALAAPRSATNVAASDLAEDVAPSGTRGYGQSETSVAVNGSYAVEAWNDATSLFSDCGAQRFKEEGIGFGFSADGGRTFTDQGGLPNDGCANVLGYRYSGDPSVDTATIGGVAYFFVSGLFNTTAVAAPSTVAVTVCAARGSGVGASLACSQPVIVAQSSECTVIPPIGLQCSFLDKDFLTVDHVHQRLYVTYTEFGFSAQPNTVALAACDIRNPTAPVCRNGGDRPAPARGPYMVVAPAPSNGCENTGAYPAVDESTGDVYVAYEHNVLAATAGLGGPCTSDPVRNVITRVPFSSLTLPRASGGVSTSDAVNITSMAAAPVPGYNRPAANDFPRIAVSVPFQTVSIVWNDARDHPLGDILMQSYRLGSLATVAAPVRLNRRTGGLHFLPGLRNADAGGRLDVVWYERATANTTLTEVEGALAVAPNATTTPPTNVSITDVPTDWNAVASNIVPNFGDYTDDYAFVSGSVRTVAVAWSDGRAGTPQAYFARRSAP